ncbi:phosphatase PAP2 family protein [Streptomyces sp. DT203]|uniref:phosphatase PAP2 family protein n=1 Tax=Streptomyces sp. DT203 TaxID=3393424 RepID=UPI003CEA88B0
MSLSPLAPLPTAVAHVAGELLKSILDEERPYRSVVAVAASPVPCPPTGHRSVPGNHTATAGPTAVALAFARPRPAWCTVPSALLMAFPRVFAGVRLPHDVAVALLAGGIGRGAGDRPAVPPRAVAHPDGKERPVPLAVRIPGPGADGRARTEPG